MHRKKEIRSSNFSTAAQLKCKNLKGNHSDDEYKWTHFCLAIVNDNAVKQCRKPIEKKKDYDEKETGKEARLNGGDCQTKAKGLQKCNGNNFVCRRRGCPRKMQNVSIPNPAREKFFFHNRQMNRCTFASLVARAQINARLHLLR